MAITLQRFLEKKKCKNVDLVMETLQKFWEEKIKDDKARTTLMSVFHSNDIVDRVEELYARENTKWDEIHKTLRLKTDPRWEKINQMVKLVEGGKCPYDKSELRALPKRQYCQVCDRIYLIPSPSIESGNE
jgi:hypothetical protein